MDARQGIEGKGQQEFTAVNDFARIPIMTQQCAFMTHRLLSEGIALPHILYFR